jgi:Vitamin K-dependent gamma-carboxylase
MKLPSPDARAAPASESWLRRWLAETGETYVVSLVRLVLGVLLFLSALREVDELRSGVFFGEVFHLPIVPEALVPSRVVFVALVALQMLLAVLVVVGRAARGALLASAMIGLYLLLCDRLGYHNNRYALFLFALLLSFAPCDRAFVMGHAEGPRRAPDTGPLFAQRLAKLQLALIYFASGGSKLLDPDWSAGRVIGDRLLRSTSLAVEKGVPEELMRWLCLPIVASVLSRLAITTELSLALLLFLPRTRFFALWWGTMFHITIELTSKVELFGWLSLTIYALFAVPTTRERVFLYDPGRPAGRRLARLVRVLDWLARFDVRQETRGLFGCAFAVIDRKGRMTTGLLGTAQITRAIPVLFPLSLPLLAAGRLTARGKDTRIGAW